VNCLVNYIGSNYIVNFAVNYPDSPRSPQGTNPVAAAARFTCLWQGVEVGPPKGTNVNSPGRSPGTRAQPNPINPEGVEQ